MNFEQINPMQWLAVEVANHAGQDKQQFEDRLQWVKDNLDDLETIPDSKLDNPMRYKKAVMGLRKAMAGEKVGHLVGMDASSSGLQIMSALTRDVAGCTATGLIGQRRADAYGVGLSIMNRLVGNKRVIVRDKIKKGIMAAYYGSHALPRELFPDNLPEFHMMLQEMSPGSYQLLNILLDSWNPEAYEHRWTLPDGFEVIIPVLTRHSVSMTHEKLNSVDVTMHYYRNEPQENGRANVANLVQSVDAYIVRQMIRRLNYRNRNELGHILTLIQEKLIKVLMSGNQEVLVSKGSRLQKYADLYEKTKMVDPVIFPYISSREGVDHLSLEHLQALDTLLRRMMSHDSFPVLTVFDEFMAHPNNVSRMLQEYREIMAEISDSNMLPFLLTQLVNDEVTLTSPKIGHLIRQSQYALS